MDILKEKIIVKIKKEGPITFDTFMEMALYEPGLGYYSSKKIKTGKVGDYYTSQHVHSLFGWMIGKQAEEFWEIMKKPKDFFIIEPGAGTGYMCKDILDYLAKRKILNSFTYVIIEKNPFLKKKQQGLLKTYKNKIKWISSLKELGTVKGCIISNELLDSFPVHIIEIDEELKEIFVNVNNNKLIEIKRYPSTNEILNYIDEFSLELYEGYRTEINLRIKDWIRSINKILKEGFVLTIDYGYPANEYYSPERNMGTLLCYHKHQISENPYENIGEKDITAHVNFSSLKKWAEEFGFETLGFCKQGTYLVSLGIDEILQDIYKNQKEYLFEVAKIKRLILPGTIGETHKVIIQYKGKQNPQLKGYSINNQVNKL